MYDDWKSEVMFCPNCNNKTSHKKFKDGGIQCNVCHTYHNKFIEYLEKLDKRVKENLDYAIRRNKQLGKGLVVGKVFYLTVADGRAYYEVTKIGPRSTTIRFREDIAVDDYMDMVLGDGGSFPTSRIEHLVGRVDRLQELFS